ncbi:hypothetical protein VPH35_126032 [Triticum aestivum]
MERMPEQQRPKLTDAAGVEDRLLKLCDGPVAARTSILARRWRRVWALLPELDFPTSTDPDGLRAAHDAPALGHLSVDAIEATPDSVAAWLPIAARRLSGVLYFRNMRGMDGSSAASPLKLPCFQNATEVVLDLHSIGLTLPPSGIFTRLADVELDVVSSPRCPSLRLFSIYNVKGLDKFTIHSESLLELDLYHLPSLQQLHVVAPALQELAVQHCFTSALNQSQLAANISAPQLVALDWKSSYDPSSVLLGEMAHLQQLTTQYLIVYGQDIFSAHNRHCLMLLHHFDHISRLGLYLVYAPLDTGRIVVACEHSFGASLFHVLRMSSGIRELETHSLCQSACICAEPSNWETEELVLPCLKEVAIVGLRGTEHELALVKRLFHWTTMLKGMTVEFHESITESKGEELHKLLLSFSRPDICMKFLHCGKACSFD